MLTRRLYKADVLDPASKTKGNHVFLMFKTEYEQNATGYIKTAVKLETLIADIRDDVKEKDESVHLSYPQDRGVFFDAAHKKVYEYWPLDDRCWNTIETLLRKYRLP